MDEGIVCTYSNIGSAHSFRVIPRPIACNRLPRESANYAKHNVTGHTPTGGCSRESSTMDESLMERHFVMDEALRGVNIFYLGVNY